MITGHRPDWVSSTVHGAHADDIAHALLGSIPDLFLEPSTPQKGYASATTFHRGGEYFCDVSHGGRNGDEYGPHLRAKSAGAAECIEIVRNHWPDECAFSRLDMAFDVTREGAFDEFVSIGLDVARESRRPMTPNQCGNWIEPTLGGSRTFNLGARKSAAYLRVYERGIKLREEHPHRAAEFDPLWIRAEIEVKPKTVEGKTILARAPLTDAWGASEWSQRFASRALGAEVDRLDVGSKQSPVVTADKQYLWLLETCGKIVATQARKRGGFPLFMEQFRTDLRERGHDV